MDIISSGWLLLLLLCRPRTNVKLTHYILSGKKKRKEEREREKKKLAFVWLSLGLPFALSTRPFSFYLLYWPAF